jgi:hypothetical protein
MSENKEDGIVVNVLENNGKTALVEYVQDAIAHRCYIPSSKIYPGGDVVLSVLKAGIKYGLPFAEFVEISVTPADIEARLHNAGIWTLDDLRSKSQAALGALQAAYALELGKLFAASEAYSNKEVLK